MPSSFAAVLPARTAHPPIRPVAATHERHQRNQQLAPHDAAAQAQQQQQQRQRQQLSTANDAAVLRLHDATDDWRTMEREEDEENRCQRPSRLLLDEVLLSTSFAKLSLGDECALHNDIYRYMLLNELRAHTPMSNVIREYDRLRADVVRWLIKVGAVHRVSQPALFLAVAIMDRYIDKSHIRLKSLQLLGATCLFTACKYEEVFPVSVADIISSSTSIITARQIYRMEMKVLHALDFKLSVSTSWAFQELFLYSMSASRLTRYLSAYLLELLLIDWRFLKHLPSRVAAACICAANFLQKREPWPMSMERCSGIPLSQLIECTGDVSWVFKRTNECDGKPWSVVMSKYARARRFSVSRRFRP